MRHFKAPKKTFADLDAGTVAHLVSASSDLTLLIDKKGVIRDLALQGGDLLERECGEWVGRPWLDVVTVESRVKVEEMLAESRANTASQWRHVNHLAKEGGDIPIRYSAIRVGDEGNVLAMGRDLRPMAAMQQKLVAAQAQMEREYAKLRQAETRYQTLFQLSGEPVIVLDAASLKIVDANPAATQFIVNGSSRVVGRSFLELLDRASARDAEKLFAELRSAVRGREIGIRLANSKKQFSLQASLFRQDNGVHYLLRLSPPGGDDEIEHLPVKSSLQAVIANMPDGFVVIDEAARILMANAAFLELAQLVTEEQAKGANIDRWLGRVDVDMDVLIANLRAHGSVRRFATVARGEFGAREEVELSAVAVTGGDAPSCYGITIRKAQAPLSVASERAPAGPRSFEELKDLVGRMPLRDLVRETTDIIEQMCIEAALELTGDNRASAAEMLGLSRQSFYVKLRRHGLGELDSQESH
ncbi:MULTISPECIES: transcriptional regulator PpsR [Rhodomicrobium]|uniref:transcriptional regulator PpsR n=1 Tax=Rhodomicrobium TaxID=1068 RepID=UPI000B4BF84C|nr:MULTISPECIES: transcriptional regulator PpsR [Rhodomicrobium]